MATTHATPPVCPSVPRHPPKKKRFARCALNTCVESEDADALRATLAWVDHANQPPTGAGAGAIAISVAATSPSPSPSADPLVPNGRLRVNADCLVRACADKRNFELVHALYDAGFELTCALVGACATATSYPTGHFLEQQTTTTTKSDI